VNEQELSDVRELRNAKVAGQRGLPSLASLNSNSGVRLLNHANIVATTSWNPPRNRTGHAVRLYQRDVAAPEVCLHQLLHCSLSGIWNGFGSIVSVHCACAASQPGDSNHDDAAAPGGLL